MLLGDRIHTSPTSPTTQSSPSLSTTRSSTPGIARPAARRRWAFVPPTSWSSGGRSTTAPAVSVSPYAWRNRHPNTSIDFTRMSSEIGDAP